MEPLERFLQWQNRTTHRSQCLQALLQNLRSHVESGSPLMFIFQGGAVITEDQQAVSAPFAVGDEIKYPGSSQDTECGKLCVP
jgi:hypothetical protein